VGGDDLIEVIFVDGSTDCEIARSTLSRAQVPASFETRTTVELGDAKWQVDRADPSSPAEVAAARTLVLTLRHLERLPPGNILYSLPTICHALPAVARAGTTAARLEIHEDDWRQIEMVSAGLRDVVLAELRAIRSIHDEHARRNADGRLAGFDAVHIRQRPARPLSIPLARNQLLSMLPPADSEYGGVAFTGMPGVAAGSFAAAFGQVQLYGLADGNAIQILCLGGTIPPPGPRPDLIRGLQHAMRAFSIVLVDWCRCSIIEPASLGDYLIRFSDSRP
jgi:hypothetical protein